MVYTGDLKSPAIMACWFESSHPHQTMPSWLNWLEQATHNRWVTGSSPVEGTKLRRRGRVAEGSRLLTCRVTQVAP